MEAIDFMKAKEEAALHVNKANSELKITHVDAPGSQIHVSSKDGKFTFFITCPSSDNVSWNVWSDCPSSQHTLEYLMDVIDLDSCKHITEVLEAVEKVVHKALGRKADQTKSDIGDEEDDENDSDDEEVDNYYAEDDFDAHKDEEVKISENKDKETELATNFFMSNGSPMAVGRLVKDLKMMSSSRQFGIVGSPKQDNLFIWEVKLVDIPKDSRLGKDLKIYSQKYHQEAAIELEVQFPSDYPFSPPFIRVLRPRFKFLTGHVTVGGSICMQMLTKSGWCPTNDIESILVQVRTEILSDPNASLDPHSTNKEYSESEARHAFTRMVHKYGWS